MRPPDVSLPAVLPFPAAPLDPKALERPAARSVAVPWGLVAGLPALGLLVSLAAGLPLFAALMAGCFLLAATLTCRRALATLAGRALRLRLAARLVVALVLGALLLCASGDPRSAVVGAVLFWLVAAACWAATAAARSLAHPFGAGSVGHPFSKPSPSPYPMAPRFAARSGPPAPPAPAKRGRRGPSWRGHPARQPGGSQMVRDPRPGAKLFRVSPDPPHAITAVEVLTAYTASDRGRRGRRLVVQAPGGARWDLFAASCFRTPAAARRDRDRLQSQEVE